MYVCVYVCIYADYVCVCVCVCVFIYADYVCMYIYSVTTVGHALFGSFFHSNMS